ncbi:MAG: hypothetical protein WCT22_01075 [Patescibacteria group bacterium]|jgi:hypothetical protein
MKKVNVSPLRCVARGCNNIPTIVFSFEDTSGMRIKGQAITCQEHEKEGLAAGLEFGNYNLRKQVYPQWLKTLHEDVIHDGPKKDSVKLETGDLERLRAFLYPGNNAAEKK